MTRNWYVIAKADFQVQTTRFKGNRKVAMIGLLGLGVVWAFLLAPLLMWFLIEQILAIPSQALIPLMPGLMRAGLMCIWFVLLIYPMLNALQEIKIGQWEVILSHNVSTRDLFIGSFVGKLPLNGLLVLYLTPIMVAPFALALSVSILGQIFIYLTFFTVTISTIWLANLVAIAIQAKLGASSRGKDIANGLAVILSLVVVLPIVGLQIFGTLMLELLGLNVFLLLPFTWAADLITRLAFAFNGVGLDWTIISLIDSALGLDLLSNILLLGGSAALFVVIALATADRLFTFNIGARTETITKIQGERIYYRGLRRMMPGSFGVLVITSLKDFGRKIQNLSRIAIMVAMAIFIPFIIVFRWIESATPLEIRPILIMMAFAYAFQGSFVFGNIGFLESKHQLWLIQGVEDGAERYVKARILQTMFFLIPIALIPATILTVVLSLGLTNFFLLFTVSYITALGSALVGIGVTASNPSYEDAKSEAAKAIKSKAYLISFLAFAAFMIADPVLGMIGFGEIFRYISQSDVLYILIVITPLPIVGLLVAYVGARKLARLE